MKNSNDTIWNRTSDLPICSTSREYLSLLHVFGHPISVLPWTSSLLFLLGWIWLCVLSALTLHFLSLMKRFLTQTVSGLFQNRVFLILSVSILVTNISIVIWLLYDQPRNRFSIPGKDQRNSSSPKGSGSALWLNQAPIQTPDGISRVENLLVRED